MRKTIIALAICLSIAITAGMATGGGVMAPYWNEGSGWSTFLIMTGDVEGAANTITVTIYSSTGDTLASTAANVTADGDPWVHSVAEFIGGAAGSSTAFGSVRFHDSDGVNTSTTAGSGLDDVNIIVDVEKDGVGAGFIIPIYPVEQADTTGKYNK